VGLSRLMALLAGAAALLPAPSVAASSRIVVTIKPVHALVLEVMHGVGEPALLVRGRSSPHSYALTPTDVIALDHASVFFRMSPALEPFTRKLVGALPKEVEVVSLMDVPGLRLLAPRRGPIFDRSGGDLSAADLGGEGRGIDAHAWLDPGNARAMVAEIASVLSRHDPAHAAIFRSNAAALAERLDALAAELDRELKPVADRPYIVFHDAMQYFERRFQLNAVGAISLSPEIPPGAKRLMVVRQKIKAVGALCVFAEPQFSAGLVNAAVEGTGARLATLDPEASLLSPGPDLYFDLLRNLAADLTRCLAAPVASRSGDGMASRAQ